MSAKRAGKSRLARRIQKASRSMWPLALLRDEDRGDQEPGEDEEEVDSEIASWEGVVGVEEEHARDRDASPAIERRKAGETMCSRAANAGRDITKLWRGAGSASGKRA